MAETRKNTQGTRVASWDKNPSSTHSPAHRYTVTLTKKGRTVESTIHRHVRTQADARTLATAFTKGEV